jgi:peptide-methionine (S)-S-oxide reductase
MELVSKIALGGGCHWCTEAVFQSLIGVEKVEQGYVASMGDNNSFSEAVIVHFNSEVISLETLIEIHLHTHKSTSNHSMRTKYRSAIYTFSEEQEEQSKAIITNFQKEFDTKLITKVYPFHSFKASREAIQNYYQNNPEKPFCETFINPKLKLLLDRFSEQINNEKLKHLV